MILACKTLQDFLGLHGVARQSGGHEGCGTFAPRYAGRLEQLLFVFTQTIDPMCDHIDQIFWHDILG